MVFPLLLCSILQQISEVYILWLFWKCFQKASFLSCKLFVGGYTGGLSPMLATMVVWKVLSYHVFRSFLLTVFPSIFLALPGYFWTVFPYVSHSHGFFKKYISFSLDGFFLLMLWFVDFIFLQFYLVCYQTIS